MQPEMRITVMGRRWWLRFVPRRVTGWNTDGWCDPPSKPGKQILIAQSLNDERRLEVVIHEMLHAADFDKKEEWIKTVAADIARVVLKLGYRGPGDGECKPARKKADP
jgi:hypothetical protein